MNIKLTLLGKTVNLHDKAARNANQVEYFEIKNSNPQYYTFSFPGVCEAIIQPSEIERFSDDLSRHIKKNKQKTKKSK